MKSSRFARKVGIARLHSKLEVLGALPAGVDWECVAQVLDRPAGEGADKLHREVGELLKEVELKPSSADTVVRRTLVARVLTPPSDGRRQPSVLLGVPDVRDLLYLMLSAEALQRAVC